MSLVAIASTAAVAGLALHQSIQNAEFVQQWHEQSHWLWLQQRNIDSQLAERLDNVEQALTWLGDQLTVLSTRITLQCDWNSIQFCVTPVSFNVSQNWTEIRRLLIVHKNITLDIQELTRNISVAFQQQLHVLSGVATMQEMGTWIESTSPDTPMLPPSHPKTKEKPGTSMDCLSKIEANQKRGKCRGH